MITDLSVLLKDVKEGRLSLEEAELRLKKEPFADIDFAKVDLHRRYRRGAEEVIYGAGKSPEQIQAIVETMLENQSKGVLITRLSEEKSSLLSFDEEIPYFYHKEARVAIVGNKRDPDGLGKILVVTAGTSDIAVAEEAAITAEFLGNDVGRIYDVGVAGIHRLMSHLDELMSASVIIAIAGMEGALASVVGGLVDCPVIAVPTSVGYGASFEGITALLSMLNSCASGVTVVNIDNGFGAGYSASMMNHMGGHK